MERYFAERQSRQWTDHGMGWGQVSRVGMGAGQCRRYSGLALKEEKYEHYTINSLLLFLEKIIGSKISGQGARWGRQEGRTGKKQHCTATRSLYIYYRLDSSLSIKRRALRWKRQPWKVRHGMA